MQLPSLRYTIFYELFSEGLSHYAEQGNTALEARAADFIFREGLL